ncbi:hypothetical protein C8N40_109138 [Pontibacter mucosus]|uniref:SpoIIAA-like protein n=1 Tax=Pontibacter mucosus TaxID=1649266 RepID=A0A2T5YEA4_9BACT|nr:hypothetical protein C8N40_109138 [Pontibacter mucosus]
MILNNDLLFTTEYNPATDIIQVSVPNLSHFSQQELLHCVAELSDAIRIYHIQHVLLECTEVSGNTEGYIVLNKQLATALKKTETQHLARLQCPDAALEEVLQRFLYELETKEDMHYTIKTFLTKEEALYWLTNSRTMKGG